MKRFKKVYIEITNVCNLACSFCPKTSRQNCFMSPELFERILQEIKGKTKFIYFHVMGEPLLHPKIGMFLKLAGTYGQRVNITTNGTLIKSVDKILLESPALRQVNFSLHSFEANDNRETIDEYLAHIFEFIRQSKRVQLLICLRLWNLKSGCHNKNNEYILERIEREFGLSYKIEEELTPCKGIKICENIFLNQAEVFEWPNIKRGTGISDRGFCYGLRDQVAFLVDGTVVPCCLDSEGVMNLGNIMEKSFEEIVKSPRAAGIFEGFSKRKTTEELCRKCGYRQRFGV